VSNGSWKDENITVEAEVGIIKQFYSVSRREKIKICCGESRSWIDEKIIF